MYLVDNIKDKVADFLTSSKARFEDRADDSIDISKGNFEKILHSGTFEDIAPFSPRPNYPNTALDTSIENITQVKNEPETTQTGMGGNNDKCHIEGLGEIESYKGDLPSPFQWMWYVPESNEIFKPSFSDPEIRSWIKDASDYHGIPHELLSVILQQENPDTSSYPHKVGQFGERTLTTFAAILDENLGGIIPDKISGGSSGFANMSRATLRDAADYTERKYNKNPLPDDVRYRAFGWDQDSRIPGDDWKADLYYSAAHLRQLTDRVTEGNYDGTLTLEEVKQITAAYNGSGPLAESYGNGAVQTLKDAADGITHLYFYEK